MDSRVEHMIQALHHWVEDHDAIARTEKALWKCLETASQDEELEISSLLPPEALRSTLRIHLHDVALAMSLPETFFRYIVINYHIFYHQQLYGTYRAFFELSGEIWDDSLTTNEDLLSRNTHRVDQTSQYESE